jgi:phage tail-like protein
MALFNPTGVRTDPLLNHNFVITLLDTSSPLGLLNSPAVSAIGDVAVGGFSECTGLEMSLKIEEYNEGGRNGGALRFPTRVSWSNITLKTGIGLSTALWDWHFGFVQGTGRRRDGTIALLDEQRMPRVIWYFSRGLPVKYSGPALNATESKVAIESIEIAHEGIYQLPFAAAGAEVSTAGASVSASIGGSFGASVSVSASVDVEF